jgi:hypothetical protein
MTKKQTTGKLSVGTRIRVKPGSSAPEFPDISIADWTGTITEIKKKKSGLQYMVEWDEATLTKMPDAYRQRCEEQRLYYLMACLNEDVIEADQ